MPSKPSSSVLGLCSLVVAAACCLWSSPSQALYVYLPDLLVISTDDDAEAWLDEMEVTMGIQGAEDPDGASNKNLNLLKRTAKIMEKHWSRLDAECDANAVFALMYLTTTYGVEQHIRDDYFANNDYLALITVAFAQLYLGAYDAWEDGDFAAVPLPWLEAFEYAQSGESSIVEDEFLGMNAHINYDLAVAVAALGTTEPDGTSRKPEMDRINHVLADVTDDVGYWVAWYYGPNAPSTPPSDEHTDPIADADTVLVLEPVYGWREQAWLNAEAIESAPDQSSRSAHDASMQQYSYGIAQGLQSPKAESPAPGRIAYCQAAN